MQLAIKEVVRSVAVKLLIGAIILFLVGMGLGAFIGYML